MGIVLAVNVKVMEGRDMTNAYALNRFQKQCFMTFYYVLLHLWVYSYLCCVELSTCPFQCGTRVTQKEKKSFHAFIMYYNVLLYCILYSPGSYTETK